ncbi:uncharacterized protein LOC122509107 isoform X2 [Leptopilina heterotoma]|uniref:uncharacterized protein LOC122509107 isoform X2 n=1 Tax=Leptopilina heterotoma TaxID=63436 RepID=UPI001CA9FFC5|nr:uncharacterized protein LOC122509107 isoform X2 [Leptopilina heterotoma]
MEKWRSKGKTIQKTESLLPPTRRQQQQQQQQQQDVDSSLTEKRKEKRWTIGGFLKRISHRDGDASSSSDTSSLNAPIIRRKKAKNQIKNKSSRRAIRSSLQTKKDLDFTYSSGKSLEINPFIFPIVESLPQELIYSRSSEGSIDGSTKKIRKDKIKARIEAKRDKLCTNSSTDESSNESKLQNGYKNDVCLRRRRNARAERLMKSLCRNDTGTKTQNTNSINEHRSSSNDYQLKIQETENPLVKQTLQYFSDFDRRNVSKNYEREKRRIDNSRRRQTQQIFPVTSENCDVQDKKSKSQEDIYLNYQVKPTPEIPFYASSLDSSYYKSPRIQNKPCSQSSYTSSPYGENPINYNREYLVNYNKESPVNYRQSPINYNESPINYTESPINYRESPMNYRENATSYREHPTDYKNSWRQNDQFEDTGIYSRIRSPSQRSDSSHRSVRTRDSPSDSLRKMTPDFDKQRSKETSNLSNNFTNILRNGSKNGSREIHEKNDSERRSSKNLEEALCELEEIYNSLQLGDEDLLERAEKRSMEEYSNKKLENVNDSEVKNSSKTENEPNIIKDDMAFRRLRSSNRPSSDGHAILSNISYLITSPIPSRRDFYYPETRQKHRNKEPDVTLDDVVFRNLHHANNSLKVVEPQPPFGIPLGPITGATESDYLHSKPTKSRSRREPDIVTDDLAFRNLRKDRSGDQKTSNFVAKKKRAVRSLSANLYTLFSGSSAPDAEWDFETNLDINGNQSDETKNFETKSKGGNAEVKGDKSGKSTLEIVQIQRKVKVPSADNESIQFRSFNTETDKRFQKYKSEICQNSQSEIGLGVEKDFQNEFNQSQAVFDRKDKDASEVHRKVDKIERGQKIERPLLKNVDVFGECARSKSGESSKINSGKIENFRSKIQCSGSKSEGEPKRTENKNRGEIEESSAGGNGEKSFAIGGDLSSNGMEKESNGIGGKVNEKPPPEILYQSKLRDLPLSGREITSGDKETTGGIQNKIVDSSEVGGKFSPEIQYEYDFPAKMKETTSNRIEIVDKIVDPREPRDAKEPKESREPSDPREPREPRELRELGELREPREIIEPRDSKNSRLVEKPSTEIKDSFHNLSSIKKETTPNQVEVEEKIKSRGDSKQTDLPTPELRDEDETTKDLGPFTEHEISIYRQLCQELENLVDSTKTFDESSNDNQPQDSSETVKFSKTSQQTENLTTDEIDEIGNEITCLREKLTNYMTSTKEMDRGNGKIITDHKRQESKINSNDKIDDNNLFMKLNNSQIDEKPHCSRKIFKARDANSSTCEGADTTLT